MYGWYRGSLFPHCSLAFQYRSQHTSKTAVQLHITAMLMDSIKIQWETSYLSLIPGHNTSYIQLYEAGTLMRPLTDLHDPKYMALSFPDLLQQCEEIFDSYAFSFTQETKVEEMTRSQSKSCTWFQLHAEESQPLGSDRYCIQIVHNHLFQQSNRYAIL